MKKTLGIIISFLFLSATTYSQTCIDCSGSQNPGTYSSVIGYNCYASGSYSTAMGFNAQALSSKSLSFGTYTKASGDRSIVIGSGVPNANIYLENSDGPSFMVGFNSRYPTFFVSEPYVIGGNFTETGRVGIGNVTDPKAKLHLKADAGETAAIFIEPNNWMGGESANLVLGTLSLGISSDYNKGFVFKSAKNYLFKDGKMGIGSFNANEPEAKLHIKSNMFEEASVFIEPYRDDIESGWYANLYLGTKTNIISGVSGTGLLYTTSRYHAFQGGNFGIGTLEPISLFHVHDEEGDFLYNQSRAIVSGNGYSASYSLATGIDEQWDISHLRQDHALYFKYNNRAQMTADPEEGIFVHNNLTVCDLEHGNPFSYPPGSIHVYHDQTVLDKKSAEFVTHDGGRIFFVPKLGNGSYNYLSSEGDVGIFWSNTTSQTTTGGRFIIAPHYTGSEDIYSGIFMTHEGNVGIHVREPSARLDVKNRLQISGWDPDPEDPKSFIVKSTEDTEVFVIRPNGETLIANKLWAQEIEVVADVWSDFVFSGSYKLKPLNEVEDFITENKHLPDVPSDQEIKEDGLNLGEMDAILLQKIEELTLYIIEQDKKIDELNERIEEMSKDK